MQVGNVTSNSEVTLNIDEAAEPSSCNLGSASCKSKCGYLSQKNYVYIHGERVIVVAIGALGGWVDIQPLFMVYWCTCMVTWVFSLN